MQSSQSPQIEKINYIAAGLLAAAGIHSLLSLLALPALAVAPAAGVAEIATKVLKIAWTSIGAISGGAVAFFALFMINARSYQKARLAAFGALVLPLIGTTGMISAFPLLPVAVTALTLLAGAKTKALFADAWTDGDGAESA